MGVAGRGFASEPNAREVWGWGSGGVPAFLSPPCRLAKNVWGEGTKGRRRFLLPPSGEPANAGAQKLDPPGLFSYLGERTEPRDWWLLGARVTWHPRPDGGGEAVLPGNRDDLERPGFPPGPGDIRTHSGGGKSQVIQLLGAATPKSLSHQALVKGLCSGLASDSRPGQQLLILDSLLGDGEAT